MQPTDHDDDKKQEQHDEPEEPRKDDPKPKAPVWDRDAWGGFTWG